MYPLIEAPFSFAFIGQKLEKFEITEVYDFFCQVNLLKEYQMERDMLLVGITCTFKGQQKEVFLFLTWRIRSIWLDCGCPCLLSISVGDCRRIKERGGGCVECREIPGPPTIALVNAPHYCSAQHIAEIALQCTT